MLNEMRNKESNQGGYEQENQNVDKSDQVGEKVVPAWEHIWLIVLLLVNILLVFSSSPTFKLPDQPEGTCCRAQVVRVGSPDQSSDVGELTLDDPHVAINGRNGRRDQEDVAANQSLRPALIDDEQSADDPR